MRVDLVDRGPRTTSLDPIRPLAGALARAGQTARLLAEQLPDDPRLEGVERLQLRAGRRGARGRSGIAPRTVAALLDPAAGAVVVPYDLAAAPGFSAPSRLAPLFAVLDPSDAPPPPPAPTGFFARLFGRRNDRKGQELARHRARWIVAPGEAERAAYLRTDPSASDRTTVLPAAVEGPVGPPDRDAARRKFRIPGDVPVALWAGGPGGEPALALARESFRRARVFFPGARLLVVGLASPSDPGVQSWPRATPAERSLAREAADVLLALGPGAAGEALLGMRGGLPALVGTGVVFPRAEPKGATRRPEAEDAGSLASDLAELFADPALRRVVGTAGRSYADGYAPERIAADFLALAGVPG